MQNLSFFQDFTNLKYLLIFWNVISIILNIAHLVITAENWQDRLKSTIVIAISTVMIFWVSNIVVQ